MNFNRKSIDNNFLGDHWNTDGSTNSNYTNLNDGHNTNSFSSCRPPTRLAELDTKFGKVPYGRHMSITNEKFHRISSSVRDCTLVDTLMKLFPIFSWISVYNVKSDLVGDIVAGFTVSALHLPQGMAYGLLAGLSPINGLYVSFFPVIIYAIMGTSKHTSIGEQSSAPQSVGLIVCAFFVCPLLGTFAIASIMTRNVIYKVGTGNLTSSGDLSSVNQVDQASGHELTALQIGTALCFAVGLIRLVMGLLKLGIFSVILSDQMVSAFSTGAAFHVVTSQIPSVLGLRDKSASGPFKLIYVSKMAVICMFASAQVHLLLISTRRLFHSIQKTSKISYLSNSLISSLPKLTNSTGIILPALA